MDPPFPVMPMAAIALVLLVHSYSLCSLFPYVGYMVRFLGATDDKDEAGKFMCDLSHDRSCDSRIPRSLGWWWQRWWWWRSVVAVVGSGGGVVFLLLMVVVLVLSLLLHYISRSIMLFDIHSP